MLQLLLISVRYAVSQIEAVTPPFLDCSLSTDCYCDIPIIALAYSVFGPLVFFSNSNALLEGEHKLKRHDALLNCDRQAQRNSSYCAKGTASCEYPDPEPGLPDQTDIVNRRDDHCYKRKDLQGGTGDELIEIRIMRCTNLMRRMLPGKCYRDAGQTRGHRNEENETRYSVGTGLVCCSDAFRFLVVELSC